MRRPNILLLYTDQQRWDAIGANDGNGAVQTPALDRLAADGVNFDHHREPRPAYGFDQLEMSDEPGSCEDAYRAWVRRVAPEQLDQLSLGLSPMGQAWREAIGVEETIRHPAERFPKRAALAFRGASE